MKTCNKCNKIKDLKDFHKKKSGAFGVKAECKDCCRQWQKTHYNKPENKKKRLTRQASDKYQLYIRSFRLKNNYGLSLEDYDNMLASQNGVCKTCGTDKPGGSKGVYFHVDHCHKTGKIRGLLCSACNSILGLAKDNTKTLLNLAKYIVKSIRPKDEIS